MPAVARHLRRSQPRHTSGLDGRGGSSYIDKVVFRDRDTNADGGRDERRYYLQNWRNDVVALITTAGAWVERYRYDAYGRPESYSVADIAGSGGGGGGPNGVVNATDSGAFSATGAVSWKNDLGSSGGSLVPDNVVNATDDLAAFNVYYAAGNNGGLGQISDTAIDNRKGLAGYEFDPILAGDGAIDGLGVPLYHVRNRVLNSYSGKWMQKDPLGYVDSMDLYEYCESDPIGLVDEFGLAASACSGCGGGGCGSASFTSSAQTVSAITSEPTPSPYTIPTDARGSVCYDWARKFIQRRGLVVDRQCQTDLLRKLVEACRNAKQGQRLDQLDLTDILRWLTTCNMNWRNLRDVKPANIPGYVDWGCEWCVSSLVVSQFAICAAATAVCVPPFSLTPPGAAACAAVIVACGVGATGMTPISFRTIAVEFCTQLGHCGGPLVPVKVYPPSRPGRVYRPGRLDPRNPNYNPGEDFRP